MKSVWLAALGAVLLAALAGCAVQPSIEVREAAELQQWQAPLNRDAPALGRIWSYPRMQWISVDELVEAVAQDDYLMLGEKHDNPDHHRIQWYLLYRLQQQQRLGALTMEMLKQEQQSLVDRAAQLQDPGLSDLKAALRWDEVKGWDWPFYGPMMQLALSQGVPLRAGNLDRARIREIYGQGEEVAALLGPDQQERVQKELEAQIIESHCGQAEGGHLKAMVRVQQNRDLSMAQAMAGLPRVSVLVAGGYHIRRDLGVPLYLLRQEPDAKLATLAMIELTEEADGGLDKALLNHQGVYDYLWFTPQMPRPDYCADWAKHSGGS
ncbi:ChaN family lipoprotein [Aestuariirhabdus litorea]|uniref:Haem-binding uptake Tiki superfamily ChaN domain-containing protein n=1 Tax=Aestuariirhabdus litorea TaxID=2528527 RepID=A0A3P3VIR4_9GAMM|nr:ChaN family lipoprotein [Aestuariirhabdus litorea]RRJ82244.1 hypothetical protein D0544_10165 [Aestuariirhabdus litorea]RWW92412.1 hypothetical protein DZC74_10150 [Endozoicomonadaceae bacterium GTF-13]